MEKTQRCICNKENIDITSLFVVSISYMQQFFFTFLFRHKRRRGKGLQLENIRLNYNFFRFAVSGKFVTYNTFCFPPIDSLKINAAGGRRPLKKENVLVHNYFLANHISRISRGWCPSKNHLMLSYSVATLIYYL